MNVLPNPICTGHSSSIWIVTMSANAIRSCQAFSSTVSNNSKTDKAGFSMEELMCDEALYSQQKAWRLHSDFGISENHHDIHSMQFHISWHDACAPFITKVKPYMCIYWLGLESPIPKMQGDLRDLCFIHKVNARLFDGILVDHFDQQTLI